MASQKQIAENIQMSLRVLADSNLLPIVHNAAPTNGATGAGFAGKGCLLVNTATGIWYTNTGTLASPTWTVVGAQT